MLEAMRRNLLVLQDTEDDKGGGGGGSNQDQLLDKVKKMINKHNGDTLAVALELYNDNFELRQKNNGLTGQVATITKERDDMKTKLDSGFLLEGDEATVVRLWEQDKVKPSDVVKQLASQGKRIKDIDRKALIAELALDPEDKDKKKQRFDPAKLSLVIDQRDLRKSDKGAIEVQNGDDWVSANEWLTKDRAALLDSIAPSGGDTRKSGHLGDTGSSSGKKPDQADIERQKAQSGAYAL